MLPVVTDFIDGKKYAVHVVNERTLFHVFPQHVTHCVIQAVKDAHQYQLSKQYQHRSADRDVEAHILNNIKSYYHWKLPPKQKF